MKKFLALLIGFVLLILLGYGFVVGYPYIFAVTIEGKLEKVERVQVEVALMQNNNQSLPPQLFSFAISVKDKTGKIWTASAEDRQWAAVNPGTCVEAKLFPYPPWKLDKSGTYYGARLLNANVCN